MLKRTLFFTTNSVFKFARGVQYPRSPAMLHEMLPNAYGAELRILQEGSRNRLFAVPMVQSDMQFCP